MPPIVNSPYEALEKFSTSFGVLLFIAIKPKIPDKTIEPKPLDSSVGLQSDGNKLA